MRKVEGLATLSGGPGGCKHSRKYPVGGGSLLGTSQVPAKSVLAGDRRQEGISISEKEVLQ